MVDDETDNDHKMGDDEMKSCDKGEEMINEMVSLGRQEMEKQSDEDDENQEIQFSFHVPPFNSV